MFLHEDNTIELAAEFKYEPSHQRNDLQRTKFPVVSWSEWLDDVNAVQKIVAQKKAKVAYSLLISEGGHFLDQPLPPGPTWKPWQLPGDFPHHASLLWFKVFSLRNEVPVC